MADGGLQMAEHERRFSPSAIRHPPSNQGGMAFFTPVFETLA